ncbi:hypothetical protein PSTG_07647 [Puccinia striiformis f. sp. tritici PST-78]|uniref:DNA 3'-5' helicase n=1 Tax=Puccinia striiformis f. sp. tritici PST-78 TaxID=1165861 RepID=A0A0L0VIH1_9BASI|nr:hypothetical protein PSTG_07647 [Puccinia striiformis f. sp. tritici PST-78]
MIKIPKGVCSPTGINVDPRLSKLCDEKLKKHIEKVSLKCYKQAAKQLQIEAVINLTIPEKDRAVIVTLNPLDGLGNNQVLEKELAGFTAINLTKLNFNKKTAADITKGVYQFAYLSPEIYLNNKLWDKLYFSPQFQNRLGLIVVDEAHMIFIWGLVQSCKGTNTFAVHIRHEDSGIFRPSYGNLGGHLLFRNEKPILLLSATCRLVAVAAIKKSLKLNDDSIDMLRGELTRPEIRIIPAPMDNSLASSLDVIKVFPSGKDITDDKLVPALVYSGSCNRTLTVLEVIDRARESHGACYSANSKCARRYHSCSVSRVEFSGSRGPQHS